VSGPPLQLVQLLSVLAAFLTITYRMLGLLLCVAVGANTVPVAAQPTNEGWLELLMQRMAAIPARQADFVEVKRVAALQRPLTLHGHLIYRRPSYLEQITIAPQAETLIADGDQLSIQSGHNDTRIVSLASQPVIAGLVDGVRATLAGDLAQLRQFYRITAQGRVAAWRLILTPIQPELANVLRSVILEGADTDIRTVNVVAANGDEQDIVITAPG
jgi:outer membrane lipoprotein-sorting protein